MLTKSYVRVENTGALLLFLWGGTYYMSGWQTDTFSREVIVQVTWLDATYLGSTQTAITLKQAGEDLQLITI